MKIKYFLILIFLHFISGSILFSYDDHHFITLNIYQSNQAQQTPNQSNQVYDNCLNYTKSNQKPKNPNKIIEKLGQNKKKDLESFESAKLNDFELCFRNYSNQDLFEQYHMYSNCNYLNYICRRPAYEDFILNLQQKIRNDKGFQESLCKTPGFKDKNGFTNLIGQEANRIRQQREKHEIERLEIIKNQAQKRKEEWIKKEINNHQKSIDFKDENLQNYKDSISEYDQDNNLTQVARKQIELLEIAFENGSKNQVTVYKKRVESIVQSLQNPDKQIKQVYQFNNQTKKYIQDYNLNLGRLSQFEGNFIEKNIHTEVVNAINDISNTMYAFNNKLNTDNIAQIIFESSGITLDLKDNKKYDRAYSLLDIMNGIFNIGKQSLFVAGEGILKGGNEFSSEIKNGIDFLINASNEDLINGTLDIAKGLYYLIRTSPISLDHMLDKMQASGKHEKNFPNYLDYCISKIHYEEQNKQFPSYNEWKPSAEKQFEELEKERTANWEKLKAEPRQFTVDTVSELTKLFLYCGLGEIATFKIGPLAKSLSNVMLDEAMLLAKKIDSLKAAANGIYDVTVEEIIQAPLINSIKMTEDAICNTVKYGKGSVTNALDVIKKNSELIAVDGSFSNAISKTINRTYNSKNDFINLASKKRTNHILFGESLKQGGHMWPGNPGKTVFPKSWNAEKIMHMASDIATDPNLKWISRSGNGGSFTKAGDPARFIVEGIRDSIKIRVVVEPAGEGIISAFPIDFGGPGVTCRVKHI